MSATNSNQKQYIVHYKTDVMSLGFNSKNKPLQHTSVMGTYSSYQLARPSKYL